MSRFTQILAPIAAATAMGSALLVGAAAAPPAFAQSTPLAGCSAPFTLAPIGTSTGPANGIDYFSQVLVQEGYFTEDSLLALLNSLDHNGDGYLCWKIPPGWNGPPATSGANRAGFVSLIDNKMAGNSQ